MPATAKTTAQLQPTTKSKTKGKSQPTTKPKAKTQLQPPKKSKTKAQSQPTKKAKKEQSQPTKKSKTKTQSQPTKSQTKAQSQPTTKALIVCVSTVTLPTISYYLSQCFGKGWSGEELGKHPHVIRHYLDAGRRSPKFINTLAGKDDLRVGHSMERETRLSSLVEVSPPNSEDTIAFLDTPGIDGDRPANDVLIYVNGWLKRSASLLTTYIITENQKAIAKATFSLVDF